jgi:sec-independent protein translocase protein TatA
MKTTGMAGRRTASSSWSSNPLSFLAFARPRLGARGHRPGRGQELLRGTEHARLVTERPNEAAHAARTESSASTMEMPMGFLPAQSIVVCSERVPQSPRADRKRFCEHLHMGNFSVWHWLIVLAIVLLVFGGRGKVSQFMGAFGKGLSAFKKGVGGSPDEAPGVNWVSSRATPPSRSLRRPRPGRRVATRTAPTRSEGSGCRVSRHRQSWFLVFVSLLVHVLIGPFKTHARLVAEIIFLRHQLNGLRRRLLRSQD